MISMICGLIGAGKSTFAQKNYDYVTDFDSGEFTTKENQVLRTLLLHDEGKEVAHITCYPTDDEMDMILDAGKENVRLIWIDTDPIQCRKNILTRGRLRDIADLGRVLGKNVELYEKLASSPLHFERVQLFEGSERW